MIRVLGLGAKFTQVDKVVETDLIDQFRPIYESQRGFVAKVLSGWVPNFAIDDLVQDCFVSAWKAFPTFRGQSKVETWLYKIAKNKAIDYLKKKQTQWREASVEVGTPQEKEEFELRQLLDLALGELSIEMREVFLLFYHLEWTAAEISELIGVPEGTVKSRIHNAKLKVIQSLKENGVEE